MYVCICNAVTESEIREAASEGANDLWSLQQQLGVASGCGTCMDAASDILNEVCGDVSHQEPVLYHPALA